MRAITMAARAGSADSGADGLAVFGASDVWDPPRPLSRRQSLPGHDAGEVFLVRAGEAGRIQRACLMYRARQGYKAVMMVSGDGGSGDVGDVAVVWCTALLESTWPRWPLGPKRGCEGQRTSATFGQVRTRVGYHYAGNGKTRRTGAPGGTTPTPGERERRSRRLPADPGVQWPFQPCVVAASIPAGLG